MSSHHTPPAAAAAPQKKQTQSRRSSRTSILLFLLAPLLILISSLFIHSTFRLPIFTSSTVTTAPNSSPHLIPRLLQLSRQLLPHHLTNNAPPSPPSTLKGRFSTMRSPKFEHELLIAQLAVQRASILTKRVFHEKAKGTVDKNDKSPVTIGDFGAQALIIAALRHHFPGDAIVAEEEAAQLKEDAGLRATIWDIVKDTKLEDQAAEELLGGGIKDEESMLELIDLGNSPGGSKGRIWTIDPIDGTKGFLRGGQYAVCLALMIDSEVTVGVLGCPNLPIDDSARLTTGIGANQTDEGQGVLFSAVLGSGATSRPLSKTTTSLEAEAYNPISMRAVEDLSKATFCESLEGGHSSHTDQAAIAQKLRITAPSVRMDSQAKYGSIARGAGDIYLRLPTSATYREKIWDHAAGDLIVREAGGQVTDIHGQRLDFSVGRTLANNRGVVAAPVAVHGKVLEVVQEVLNAKL